MSRVDIDFGFEGSRRAWREHKARERHDSQLLWIGLLIVVVAAITVFHFFILPSLIPNIN